MDYRIDIPENPYLPGQVFDSTPFVHLYLQQDAHRRAKEAAFEGYLSDLQKNVTPTGMRNQDVNGFTNKANEWMQYGIQNKKYIQNPTLDGGKARSEFLGRHQELLGYTAASKNEFEKAKQLQSIRNDPDKFRRVNQETLQRWDKSNKSIFDADFQPLDTNDIGFDRKPFDIQSQAAYDKHLVSGLDTKPVLKETVRNPSDPLSLIDRYEHRYNDDALKTIAARGVSAFNSDPTVHDEILSLTDKILPRPGRFDKSKLEVPPEFPAYNDAFKKVAGRDIQNEADVAAADALLRTNKSAVEEKSRPNKSAEMAMQEGRERRMAGFRQGLAKDLVNYKKSVDRSEKNKDEGKEDTIVEKYLNGLIDEADKNGRPYYENRNGEQLLAGKEIKMSATETEAFSKRVGSQKIAPDKTIVLPNGNIKTTFYKVYSKSDPEVVAAKAKPGELVKVNGKPVVDTDLSSEMTPQQAKFALGNHLFSGKLLKNELAGKPTGNKPVNPPATQADKWSKYKRS